MARADGPSMSTKGGHSSRRALPLSCCAVLADGRGEVAEGGFGRPDSLGERLGCAVPAAGSVP